MLLKVRELTEKSDLIVVGRSGIITSTGSSINSEIEVERVLKGTLGCDRIRIAFTSRGRPSPPGLDPEAHVILFLEFLRVDDIPVYRLVNDDLDAIVPCDDQVLQGIQTLVTGQRSRGGS